MLKKISMADKVMNQIRDDDIKMKPKIYFQAICFGKIILLALLFVLAVYFFNVVFFKFRIYYIWQFLNFGSAGWMPFLKSVPWVLATFGILSFISFGVFLKRLDFSYRSNFAAVVSLLFVVMVLSGNFLDRTGLNENLKADGSLPQIYAGQYKGEDFLIGQIVEVKGKEVKIRTPYKHEEFILSYDDNTSFPRAKKLIIGEYLQAVGRFESGVFKASGIIPQKGY